MKRLLSAVFALVVAASPAISGPNAGGVMIVHDTGLTFSTVTDLPIPPPTAPPVSCEATDNYAPLGTPTLQTVWKVYAAFPPASSPRLKGLAWGIAGTGDNYVTTAGLPDPPNCFQVVQGSWPSPPGSIGQSFVFTQTATIVECYWFGGYSYGGIFATVPHEVGVSEFVDDAVPGNTDDVAGYSTLGFGMPGETTCPCCSPGACCLDTGECMYVMSAECEALGGDFQGDGVPCTPQVCLPNPVEQRSWSRIKATFR
jgi:hypothetical protein